MLNETVHPQPEKSFNSETDLGALAEHLSVIADALRKTTNGIPALEKFTQTGTPQTGTPQTGTGVAPEGAASRPENDSQASGLQADMEGFALSPFYSTDITVQRRQYACLAREAYAVRRRRSVIFDNDEIFGEPAWDILLDLYIAHVENTPVSVSSACIGSAAPPTTGLRWLGVLADHGLILRRHDPEDQRRVLVCLTDKGLTAMDEYFASTRIAA